MSHVTTVWHRTTRIVQRQVSQPRGRKLLRKLASAGGVPEGCPWCFRVHVGARRTYTFSSTDGRINVSSAKVRETQERKEVA